LLNKSSNADATSSFAFGALGASSFSQGKSPLISDVPPKSTETLFCVATGCAFGFGASNSSTISSLVPADGFNQFSKTDFNSA